MLTLKLETSDGGVGEVVFPTPYWQMIVPEIIQALTQERRMPEMRVPSGDGKQLFKTRAMDNVTHFSIEWDPS